MPRVLVIEDSPTQAQQMTLVLEEAGFEVETAPDAERGLGRLSAGDIDVVLSDLHLPGDSGFDLCRRVKADPALRGTPVVVCTSEADPVNVLHGLQAGADGFITKHREPEEIVGCVRRALARPPSAGEPEPATEVRFLDQRFELSAGREQLLDVLVSAFEDVVHLNERFQASTAELRSVNRKLEDRNRELQRLADSERKAMEELSKAHEERKRAQSQLVQAEKLTGLSQMVAGFAHEVNNPLSFVINNLTVLTRDTNSLKEMIALYDQAVQAPEADRPGLLQGVRDRAEEVDLPYLTENLDRMIDRTCAGVRRIRQIVLDLRDFVRLDESDLKAVDLNDGVATTVGFIQRRAQDNRVFLETELEPLPPVTCYPGKINQVVFNLVNNAIDFSKPEGQVRVLTRRAEGGVEIHVVDNGCGIPPEVRGKIFDPFFTTKPQGQGTGLGLSTCHGIVHSHGGRIDVESDVGGGTRFIVRLPTEPPPEPRRDGG